MSDKCLRVLFGDFSTAIEALGGGHAFISGRAAQTNSCVERVQHTS